MLSRPIERYSDRNKIKPGGGKKIIKTMNKALQKKIKFRE